MQLLQRFWCPIEGSYRLDNDGFLADPEEEYAKWYSSNAVAFSKIAHQPCLALLGEPGIGKSTAIRSLISSLAEECVTTGEKLLSIDLSEFGSEDRLDRRIVESDQFKCWATKQGVLHLVLDSLDECRIRIPTIASLLISIFKNNIDVLPNLRLRIACRTADWPLLLTSELQKLWEPTGYAAYEMLPLRRRDIAHAAKLEGLDEEKFIDAIRHANAQPLAIKPITLKFLLNEFKKGKGLPAKQADLYESGCRLLCSEGSTSYQAVRHTGSLDPDQRLAIASRIAAIMVLCRKRAITTSALNEEISADVMPINAITGGTENVKGNFLEVTESQVREVLATGLFSGHGAHLLGFAHQTYAEYLGARYINTHGLDLKQIASLIFHQEDGYGRVIPQLSELAGWLASMNRDVFKQIMDSDPVILLRSDASTADNASRAFAIYGVLKKLENVETCDDDWSLRERCARFFHPKLAEQLLPYITGKTKEVQVRRVAIDIAESAGLSSLQDELVTVALDRSDTHHIRYHAVRAVAEIGDDAHRLQLRPLLSADELEDPDDQLRGYAMRALWPKRLIHLDELLPFIAEPRRKSFMGSYDVFINHEFAPSLTVDELPHVLNWLRTNHDDNPDDFSVDLHGLNDKVVLKAVENLSEYAIRISLARYALKKLKKYQPIFSSYTSSKEQEKLFGDQNIRHVLLGEVVRQIDGDADDAGFLAWPPLELAIDADLQWLLDQAVDASEPEISKRYVYLAKCVFSIRNDLNIDIIIHASQKSEFVRMTFSDYLNAVELKSEEAERLKSTYRHHLEVNSRRRARSPVDPLITERVKDLLDQYESGKTDAWWQLNDCMCFDYAGQANERDGLEDDLRNLPGWKDALLATRQRILHAANSYIDVGNPDNAEWLGTNTIYQPARAGYRALVLLAHEEPQSFNLLPPEIWKKWAACVLEFPASAIIVSNEGTEIDLVALSYKNAPTETIHALLAIMDEENNQENLSRLVILDKMKNCWDMQLCLAMLEKARDVRLKPSCLGDLLKHLMEHGCLEARSLAQSFVTIPIATDGHSRTLAREAAIALIEQADDAGWPIVWPAFQSDRDWGRSVVEAIAQWDRRKGGVASRLAEVDLADFYLWLAREYPYAEDPARDGAHYVGTRETIAIFRNGVLKALEERGTLSAIKAIQKIANELPDLQWLKYTLVSARDRMLRQTWIPPQPVEVLQLCATRSSRLVRSASELQDTLIEALEEIDQELQGETPASPDLWNLPTSYADLTPIRPKDENRLSDWLKLRLETNLNGRGIVSLREVEIRKGEGIGNNRNQGERIDLHVTGLVPGISGGSFDTVRVIIEVKGCWHSEVKTAMQTQLVDRYLADNLCQHGIYLVGWYMCDQWDSQDNRKSKTPGWTIGQARHEFEQQAAEYSTDDCRIRAVVLNTALR